MCVNQHNQIIVTDTGNHRVQIFDGNGQFLFTFGSKGSNNSELNYPKGLCVDKHNNIIIADQWNKRISVWNESQQFIKHIQTEYSPNFITTTKRQRLIVTYQQHCVGFESF